MPIRKKSHSTKKRFKTQKAQNVRKRTRSKYIKKLRRKSILIGGAKRRENMTNQKTANQIKKNRKERTQKFMVVGETCPAASANTKEIYRGKDKDGNDIFIQCKRKCTHKNKTWDKVDPKNVKIIDGKFKLINPAESGTYIDVEDVEGEEEGPGKGFESGFDPEDLIGSEDSKPLKQLNMNRLNNEIKNNSDPEIIIGPDGK